MTGIAKGCEVRKSIGFQMTPQAKPVERSVMVNGKLPAEVFGRDAAVNTDLIASSGLRLCVLPTRPVVAVLAAIDEPEVISDHQVALLGETLALARTVDERPTGVTGKVSAAVRTGLGDKLGCLEFIVTLVRTVLTGTVTVVAKLFAALLTGTCKALPLPGRLGIALPSAVAAQAVASQRIGELLAALGTGARDNLMFLLRFMVAIIRAKKRGQALLPGKYPLALEALSGCALILFLKGTLAGLGAVGARFRELALKRLLALSTNALELVVVPLLFVAGFRAVFVGLAPPPDEIPATDLTGFIGWLFCHCCVPSHALLAIN
jgi:hypothetical protein